MPFQVHKSRDLLGPNFGNLAGAERKPTVNFEMMDAEHSSTPDQGLTAQVFRSLLNDHSILAIVAGRIFGRITRS
jgi:hypothetical protein